MLIVTTETVAGYRIHVVLGQVFGLTIRSRNAYKEGLAKLTGGGDPNALKTLISVRQEAITLMATAAAERGGNAIVCMRFHHRDVTNSCAEICAYGTAVVLVPETPYVNPLGAATAGATQPGRPPRPGPPAPRQGSVGAPPAPPAQRAPGNPALPAPADPSTRPS
jgi:uncharacterized protein YbjQ (UPF0145 family)